jgi:glutamate-1-semialdehyde 2,1-aminomutase
MTSSSSNTRANATLSAALDDAQANYVAGRPKSKAAHLEAGEFMPGGNTRTVLHYAPFPIRVVHGEGQKITDADGITYVNMLGEYTAGLFGHSHPVIRRAIDRALDHGINLSGHGENEISLARLVCERFPSIERVRFTNSGTEANLMAISTARYITGKSKVMVFDGGYHGGLLYFSHGGIPINAPFPYVVAPYNNVAETQKLIRQHGDDLACVIAEPMMGATGCLPGSLEFLETLRAGTTEAGALLIFDEVMTSRLAAGGAQELSGVHADLTTLGKYIGGGMSFGAFGGRANLIDIYDPARPDAIPHAGTFNNNALTMAAGTAALAEVYTPAMARELNARGDRFRERLNQIIRARNLALQFTGIGSLLGLHASADPIVTPDDLEGLDDQVIDLIFFDLLEAGYYMAKRGFIALSLAVTDDDLDGFASAFEEILDSRRNVF